MSQYTKFWVLSDNFLYRYRTTPGPVWRKSTVLILIYDHILKWTGSIWMHVKPMFVSKNPSSEDTCRNWVTDGKYGTAGGLYLIGGQEPWYISSKTSYFRTSYLESGSTFDPFQNEQRTRGCTSHCIPPHYGRINRQVFEVWTKVLFEDHSKELCPNGPYERSFANMVGLPHLGNRK